MSADLSSFHRRTVVGVPREICPGERRVSLTPASVPRLTKAGLPVMVETGAGGGAGFVDDEYRLKGAAIVTRREVFEADVVLQIRCPGANRERGREDLAWLRPGQFVIGCANPLGAPHALAEAAERKVTTFALEFMPRIARAQTMDVMSTQAAIAGYNAVLLAAWTLPKMFAMLATSAGTIPPARVFVLGAGVMGLEAIATARRLGGVVEGYDIRPEVREEVESLGARFVHLDVGEPIEDAAGWATPPSARFLERERRMVAGALEDSDVVLLSARIPGWHAPLLVTADMLDEMQAGSVVLDLVTEAGGNCELSRPDETVVAGGVTILGPTNLPSETPRQASQLFARAISNFLLAMVHDGEVHPDLTDQIQRETLITLDGEVVHPRVAMLLDGGGEEC